jgi:RimJ/RimL family protein N-acetyltransferase
MDQFIGVPDIWGQGIGTQLVFTVSRHLLQNKQAQRVVVDPRVDNPRAIHVYEKCGFHTVRRLLRHEWHEGTYHDGWLMEISETAGIIPR